MGCGQGKGSKKISAKSLKMKETGMASVDAFTAKAHEILDDFDVLVEPLNNLESVIMQNTGFKGIPHSSLGIAVKSMFLCLATAVAGDLKKLDL